MGRTSQWAYRVLPLNAPFPVGDAHPPLEIHWKAFPGWELLGFDMPLNKATQGGNLRLGCHWQGTGDFAPPTVLVSLDSADGQKRIWRERSKFLQIAERRLKPGEQTLFREEFIIWLPSDAPPGDYNFTIQAAPEIGNRTTGIKPEGLNISISPREN
jgi:hypothetical protein